jgi:hypothetical protein
MRKIKEEEEEERNKRAAEFLFYEVPFQITHFLYHLTFTISLLSSDSI